MPVKSKEDEHKWQKAKELAKEQGKPENYAYIMGIYKSMKPDYFKAAARRVAARWLAAAPKPPAPLKVTEVKMSAYGVDEWATVEIKIKGDWDAPQGSQAEKELAQRIYEAASDTPAWQAALSRLPATIETVDEYDPDYDDAYEEDRDLPTQTTYVPRPRSWRDIEDWEVRKDIARFTLSGRN